MSARIRSSRRNRVVDRPDTGSALHVGRVRSGNAREHHVIGQGGGEAVEEGRDRLVAGISECGEAVHCARDRIIDQRVDRCRDVEQRAGRLHDDEPITGREPLRQISSDAHHTITAERDLLSGEQPAQWCDLWSRRHRN